MPNPVRRIHQYWPPAGVLYRTTDALSVVAGLAIASLEPQARWTTAEHYLLAGLSAIIFYGFVAELSGMYRSWRGVSTQREIISLLFVWVLTSFLLLGWGFVTKHTGEFSRLALFTWFVISPVLIICCRLGIRLLQRILRTLGYNSRNFAIIGVTELGFQLARNIEKLPEMGLKLLGFYDDRGDDRTPDVPEDIGRRIGNLDDLLRACPGWGSGHYLHHLSHACRGAHSRRAKPAERHHGLGLRSARFLRFRIAAFSLDRHPGPAGGKRVRDAFLRHRRDG